MDRVARYPEGPVRPALAVCWHGVLALPMVKAEAAPQLPRPRPVLPRLYHTVLYGSAYMVGFLCALLYLFLVLICYPGAACVCLLPT